jgi:ParB-like chromosome segregation protein Spo0J
MAKDIDWDAVEREYRAGIKTHREIAVQFNVSHTAIQKKAEKFGWTRNLTAKIKAKAEDKVARKEVARKVAKITESDIIESEACKQVAILEKESAEIQALVRITDNCSDELEKIKDDLEKKLRLTKILTDNREKIINLRRRNAGITDVQANQPANNIIFNMGKAELSETIRTIQGKFDRLGINVT